MKLILKALMVFGLTVAILVPLLMINGTIQERQRYHQQAVHAIAQRSAGAQSIAGPVLIVPYIDLVDVEEKNDRGEVVRVVKQQQAGRWAFFPQSMDMRGRITPKSKFLGLHEVRTYELDGSIVASLRATIPADDTPASPRTIGRPYLNYGIADVRGLQGLPQLKIGGRESKLERGLGGHEGNGLHILLDAPKEGDEIALETQFKFALNGTESLAVMPLAQRNTIALESSWPHPQFNGSFPARSQSVSASGFSGMWEVSSLASNAQAQYLAGKILPDVSAIGLSSSYREDGVSGSTGSDIDAVSVSLVDPVDIYTQADRASKYGILFVVLTFVGFFMFELIKQLRIHPIQYGLVGLALAIFFLLLIALSEHIDFGLAYLIASAACIGLLGFYVSHVLGSWPRGVGFAMMIATLYAALYGLLISEDNAMVMGAGLLFVILATIMVVTRKVDWYKLGASVVPPPMPRAPQPPQAPIPPMPPQSPLEAQPA
jgi:inner membrane protein